ncbi:hypothetical protein [Patulibacter sp.]|uniref:hypothetical protein n=1 Tax=Patulibacter sp. TaxID=1912859 RepID=UPI002720EA12|nr:hypothetical protein [Patulibacter sp.]MDO9407397.1 hypothetical protein [Patulibacter sp.]
MSFPLPSGAVSSFPKRRPGRRTRRAALGSIAVAGVSALAVAAAPASAAPTGQYADFDQCPTGNAAVVTCIVSDTTSGNIKLGNQDVPITKRIRLQGGIDIGDEITGQNVFYGAKNGQTLEKTALDVPGGLLGITIPPSVPQPVRGALQKAIDTANGVKATAELVGPVGFNFANYANAEGVGVTLPIRVKLENAFLGSNCYVGSAASPITIRLTNGTTAPPAGVAPISGTLGSIDFLDDANLLVNTGLTLVDNTFTAPKAKGCGGAFSWAIDPVVDLKIGLPTTAGQSVARFTGDAKLGSASRVVDSESGN